MCRTCRRAQVGSIETYGKYGKYGKIWKIWNQVGSFSKAHRFFFPPKYGKFSGGKRSCNSIFRRTFGHSPSRFMCPMGNRENDSGTSWYRHFRKPPKIDDFTIFYQLYTMYSLGFSYMFPSFSPIFSMMFPSFSHRFPMIFPSISKHQRRPQRSSSAARPESWPLRCFCCFQITKI